MSIAPGTRLGPYEVIAALGAGGMGEVYRARDTKLDRDVALKILPASFANDPDRLMRFEREARALAAFSHPNIAGIYEMMPGPDVISSVLVMELVEGQDLSALIARGAIPVDDALAIAKQIADALEAAHERGIIHRDLKPANVKVRADGTVKVLDFGLAKLTDGNVGRGFSRADSGAPEGTPYVLSGLPTMTSPALTAMGLILGTAAYMSPEQAKGRAIDRRADVWAFGVVLFEMLTGKRVFEGGEVTEVLASVLKDTPSHESLPAGTPPAIRRLLRRCLEKHPANRLDSMAAARLEIEEALRDPDGVAGALAVPSSAAPRSVVPWAIAALATVIAVVAGVMVWRTPAPLAARMSISLPPGHQVTSGPIITRDGTRIVFASGSGIGEPRLYLRTMESFELKELPGTEGASRPFFSPDGRWVGFFAKGRLFKLELAGGVPTPLTDAPSGGGGTWAEDGTIVFAPTWNGGLYRITAGGGDRELIIKPDSAKQEYAYVSPRFLAGGSTLLFSVWGATFNVERLTLAGLQREVVVPGFWTNAIDTTSGHLLLGSDQGDVKAFAAGADSAVTVMEGVHWSGRSGDGRFKMAVSDEGTLVYAPGDITQRSLAIVDETGRAEPVPAEWQTYLWAAVSPDGRRAATEQDGTLWLVDLERGGRTPLTPPFRSGVQSSPVWSRDASRVFFASNVEGNWEIYSVSAARPDEIKIEVKKEFDQFPTSMAADGTLFFEELRPGVGTDIWLLPPGGAPVAWLATPAEEEAATPSPDGRLVAYASKASGRYEVYVRARDGSGGGVPVSTNGGEEPVWAPTGSRIFFREGNAMMAASVQAGPTVSVSRPQQLFDRGWELSTGVGFSVMPDSKRFLMVRFAPAAIPTRLDVIFNWFEELKARVK